MGKVDPTAPHAPRSPPDVYPPPVTEEKPYQDPAAYPPPPYPPPQPAAYPPPQPAAYPPLDEGVPPKQHPSPMAHQTAQMGHPMTPVHVVQAMPVNSQEWTTSLFDCFDDPTNALITFCFPCVTFGQIAEIIDQGQTTCMTGGVIYCLLSSFLGIPCVYSCGFRTKLRAWMGLAETPGPDWLVHCCCETCAVCQLYRELHNRGWDPTISWQANASKQTVQMVMVPPGQQTMMS